MSGISGVPFCLSRPSVSTFLVAVDRGSQDTGMLLPVLARGRGL
jgi:hypothetical protein